MAEPVEALTLQVGERIRQKRMERGLSVRELARRTEVAPSYISQVERGLTTPSIPKLRHISEVLEVPVFWFFMEDYTPQVVVRRGERRRMALDGSDHQYEMLTNSTGGKLQVMELHLDPGASTQPEPRGHAGEELALVSEGAVRLQLGDDVYELHAGDSAHYEASLAHRYTNIGEGTAVVLFVMTPPI